MKLHKGINRDASPSELTEGHWIRARNKVMSRMLDSLNDEYGFAIFGDYPEELRPNGFIELANGETVVFSIPSEIGILKEDGTYIRKVADPLLGFSPDYPITGDYHYGFNNRLIVAFRAENIKPKILNLDKLPFKVDSNGALLEPDHINLMNLFPEAEVPTIKLDRVNDSGGSLLSGVYYIGVAYEVEKEDATNYLQVSAPITIVKDHSTTPVDQYHGTEAGEATTKSISITLNGLDNRFKYVKIALVSKINGLISAKEVKRLLINSDTMSFQITGAETSTPILNEEILVQRIDYQRIGTITNMEGTLYAANVKSEADLDFQSVANNIKINWYYEDNIELDKVEGSYKDPSTIYSKRMFMFDEVYAFYAKVTLAGGADGGAYHIPGREVGYFVAGNGGEFLENTRFSDLVDGSTPLYAEEQSVAPNGKYFQMRDTSAANGTMSYWENSNEEYPNTTREDGTRIFPEGKVRHHKFPSINRLSREYGKPFLTGAAGSVRTKALGIKVSNIVIPEELQDKIQSIEICYARRTMDNSTVYGYSEVLGNSWVMIENNNTLLKYNPFSVGLRNDKWIRTHPFDMLLDKPATLADYLRIELAASPDFTTGIDQNGYFDKRSSTNNTWEYKAVRRDKTTYNYSKAATTLRILESRYMPHNNSALEGELDNYLKEEVLMIRPSSVVPDLDQALISIKAYKSDLYVSFTDQELVSTGSEAEENAVIYGGDTFVSPYGVRATYFLDQGVNSYSHPYREILTKYYIPTVNNAGLRNTGDEWYETYYPYDNRNWLSIYLDYLDYNDPEIHAHIIGSMNHSNYFGYTKDYTSVNDLNKAYPYTGEEEETERPFLIMRSKRVLAEERNQSWRIFLPNDYYESVKNRGPIENLQAYGSMLIIHHRYDLLRTVEKTTIETSEGVATLGSGDLFRMKPEPIVPSKDGYAGTQNQLSCTLTKVGYLFASVEHGKIFLLNDQLNELSSRGLYEFFRKKLPFEKHDDNPYFGAGIITTYDEENNRVLITKKETILEDKSKFKGRVENVDLSSLQVGDVVLKDGKYKIITAINR